MVVTHAEHRPIPRVLLRGLTACSVAVAGATSRGTVASPVATATRPPTATTTSASASQFLLKNKRNIAKRKQNISKSAATKVASSEPPPQVGSASKRDYKGAARVFLCEDNRTHDCASLHCSPKLLFVFIKNTIRQSALFIRQSLFYTRRTLFFTRQTLSYR